MNAQPEVAGREPFALTGDLPDATMAVVLLSHANDGGLDATYAERRVAVPAPRRQVAEALRRLARSLDEQADALDTPPGDVGKQQPRHL